MSIPTGEAALKDYLTSNDEQYRELAMSTADLKSDWIN
jgi:hypothetical protein